MRSGSTLETAQCFALEDGTNNVIIRVEDSVYSFDEDIYQEQELILTEETTESEAQKDSEPKTSEPSSKEEKKDGNNSETAETVPADVTEKVDELNNKFDSIISQAQGFVDDPKSFTLSAYTEFMTAYTDIITDYGKISEIMNEYEDQISTWDGYDMWMSIMNKNLELITVIS